MISRISTLPEVRAKLEPHQSIANTWIYSHPAFLDFLADVSHSEIRIVVAEEGDRIVGMIPFAVRTQPGVGAMINSLPWYGSHGGCLVDAGLADGDSVRRSLLCTYKEFIDRPDLISATLILSHGEEAHRALYEEELRPTIVDGRIGQITHLPQSPEDAETRLLEIFQQKTRNLARKSLKQSFKEVVTDAPEAWDFLIDTHTENILALNGKPKPRAHFEALRKHLPPGMRRLSLALDGDQPLAALLLLYGGDMIEYVTPAVRVEARSRQPNTFLIWRGMLDGVARGYRRWNWGGTWIDQSSLHHFKAGFGARDFPYTYFINAPESGVTTLRRIRSELDALFPYFYAFPFARLDAPRENS